MTVQEALQHTQQALTDAKQQLAVSEYAREVTERSSATFQVRDNRTDTH